MGGGEQLGEYSGLEEEGGAARGVLGTGGPGHSVTGSSCRSRRRRRWMRCRATQSWNGQESPHRDTPPPPHSPHGY